MKIFISNFSALIRAASKKTAIFLTALCALATAQAADLNIKYSSNYLMPAYVHFKENGTQYSILAKINVPLYNIQFITNGVQLNKQFRMTAYKDVRNDKTYSQAKVEGNNIEYGKLKDGLKNEIAKLPTFDLFSMAFQLTYYEKLPTSFQLTNGKKLYPMENVFVRKSESTVKYNKQEVTEITYQFKTGDKDVTVKKFAGEQFPRYLKYTRDDDDYELTFDSFVK